MPPLDGDSFCPKKFLRDSFRIGVLKIVITAANSRNKRRKALSHKPSSPKAIAQAESLRKVPSTGPRIDLMHGPRPTLSPKDPRYDQELRRLLEIQVAPLK